MEAKRVSYKDLDILYPKLDKSIKEKAVNLANGMISVYGYDLDSAILEAISIAKEWFENDEKKSLTD
jgi:uncharacterized protein YdaT